MSSRCVFSAIGKVLKWALIIPFSIYGLLAAINLMDEALSPESKALMASPQAADDPGNGFLALVGTNAPPNEDPVGYGVDWVSSYNAATDHESVVKAGARFSYDTLPFRGDDKLLCNPRKTLCLPQANERGVVWRKMATDNELLLTRQRGLAAFTKFDETYFPPTIQTPLPNYRNQSRLLALDLIALDAADGKLETALSALDDRIAFDRLALLGSRSMLTGMVAASWLGQDYALLSEVVAANSSMLQQHKARLYRMTEPLQVDSLRTVAKRLFEGEFITQSHSLLSLTPEVIRQSIGFELNHTLVLLSWPFFKPHATINQWAREQAVIESRILDFSPEKYDTWVTQFAQDRQSVRDRIYSWRTLYNPTGKIISLWARDYSGEDYVLRLSDVIGTTRLLRLQIKVLRDRTTDADMASTLADKTLHDPYSGKPMTWDATNRWLSFDARSDTPQGAPKRIKAGI